MTEVFERTVQLEPGPKYMIEANVASNKVHFKLEDEGFSD